MILKFITFDVVNNTIEANWHRPLLDSEGVTVGYESALRINYSADQKAEFLADVEGGQTYSDAMGW